MDFNVRCTHLTEHQSREKQYPKANGVQGMSNADPETIPFTEEKANYFRVILSEFQ